MASQNTNPFYGSSSGGVPASGNQHRLALDNLIRRELKVSDPNDPKQIADALLARFKDDPRANAITQEANGLPFLLSAGAQLPAAAAATSSNTEWQQAVGDVERDLLELTNNAILKDIKVELQGWASAIRQAITDGVTAARFSLDIRQRDKVFAVRRTLGDYARLARLVGTLTPSMTTNYRKFAQSLDEVSSVLLVLMGEALANVGFNGGRFLLQVPYSELQARRDAAIYALRNLLGTAQEAYGNDWQRGIGAYRNLMQSLEDQGQGDLRSLLVEGELARTMDNLIQRAGQGSVEGLRQLGATAQFDVERFRRLIFISQDTPSCYAAPPLAAFLDALLLFVQAFDSAGGFRLLRIARPPILFYGLYGMGGVDNADQRLVRLIVQRGTLADRLDDFLQIADGTDAEKNKAQIVLDKLLYDVDRSIDMYALGSKDFGEPEKRASAYGKLIGEVVTEATLSGLIALAYIPPPRREASGLIDIDIKGTSDYSGEGEHIFAYIPVDKTLSGGEIIARLVSINDSDPDTIAGLMIRIGNSSSFSVRDEFSMIGVSGDLSLWTGSHPVTSKTKAKKPVWTSSTANLDVAAFWLKITWEFTIPDPTKPDQRSFDYTLAASTDGSGENWNSYANDSYLIGDKDDIFVGLAVSSDTEEEEKISIVANYDNVRVQGGQDGKTGEFRADWGEPIHITTVGSNKVSPTPVASSKTSNDLKNEGLYFNRSYLQVSMQRDQILRDALLTISNLLNPRDGTINGIKILNKEPWDEDSRNAAISPETKKRQRMELCLQKDQESRWESLVKTLSSSLTGYDNGAIIRLLDAAIRNSDKHTCRPLDVRIPPTEEESQYWLSQTALNAYSNSDIGKKNPLITIEHPLD